MKSIVLASAFLAAMAGLNTPSMAGNSDKVTLIHIGDIHGHMMPRPNARSDGNGSDEGGLARMYTQIQQIRKHEKNTLLLNTGDTIQGSAEAMFTRGQALVDVLNKFGIDAFAPGNWDFVYGNERFLEFFGPGAPKAPWNALAANLFYDGEPYAAKTGQRVLPPYMIKQVGNLKVGLLGLTTDRGPQVVGKGVTKGFRFLKNGDELDAEVAAQVKQLRETEKVDLLVVLSEMGVANNLRMADKIPGMDAILSSDMHEITRRPVVSKYGTVIVEEGQDGAVMGQLALTVKDGKMEKWDWTLHRLDKRIKENKEIAALVKETRKSFVTGPDFKQHVNPFNGTLLPRPIDTVVGYTKIALHRSNFSHENMPAVIESSSSDFLADAFRAQTGSDIGAIRGFRYGTHVLPGPIKMEDLYHFIPVGPMIARGTIKGKDLKTQIENSADGSLSSNVIAWAVGGWMFNFSGVTMNLHPFAEKGARASSVMIFNKKKNAWEALDPNADYTYASYYYKRDPDLINVLPAANIEVLTDEKGNPLDGVEVVVRYLQSLPEKTANPELNRIKLLVPLTPSRIGSPLIQPW